MPRLATQRRQFVMRAEDKFFEALDELRAAERPIKSRAEIVRKLVAQATAKAKPKKRG